MNEAKSKIIPSSEEVLTTNQLKEDYYLLRECFEEGHSGLYVHRNKIEIDSKFEDLFNRLDKSTTVLNFYKIIAEFIDFVADGHTTVNFDSRIRNHILNEIGIIPIKPYIINGKMYVLRNFSEHNELPTGTEILKIDNISISEIIENLLQFVYIDGFGTERKFRLLERDFGKLLSFVYGAKNTFEVTYRRMGEKEVKEIKLAATTLKEIKEVNEKRFSEDINSPLYSLIFHTDLKAAILTIKTFNPGKTMTKLTGIKRYSNEDKFPVFLKKSFRIIKDGGFENLILDLRGNSGGREDYGALLYSYLTKSEFRYFDAVSLKKKNYDFFKKTNNKMFSLILKLIKKEEVEDGYKIHNPFFMPPLYNIHKMKKDSFKGKVFILIDGGSFSAACEFLTTCHRFQRATFIGEETRGAYIGNNSGLMVNVSLPNSKLILRIPLFRFILPVSQKDNHRGILPDYEIKPSIEDIISGKDTVLEYTLESIES